MLNKSYLYQKHFFLKVENKNVGYDHLHQNQILSPHILLMLCYGQTVNLRLSALFGETL